MAQTSLPPRFDKYEGLGNDFILFEVPEVADAAEAADVPSADAVRLCDRRRGVGADGILLLLPSRAGGAVARMRVINADGSTPEMCGNGLRCVALHLATRRGQLAPVVETDAGLRACSIEGAPHASSADAITVGMGRVVVEGARSIVVDGRNVDVWVASAGNPHAVLFGAFDREAIERLGPRIATHAAFPRGTNVGFAAVRQDGVDLVVWERGAGLTLACGTGACAAVAVGVARGLLPGGPRIEVRLPGGALSVSHDPTTGESSIRGPARHVYSGALDGT
jgi:diaminopimelate epimerase